MKFAEFESRFSWLFLKAERSLLATLRTAIFDMKTTTLITTDEDSCVITKRLLIKATEEALIKENVVINLINRFKEHTFWLKYNIEKSYKRADFRIINDLRSYVMLNIRDQNSIFVKKLTDEDTTSQSVI